MGTVGGIYPRRTPQVNRIEHMDRKEKGQHAPHSCPQMAQMNADLPLRSPIRPQRAQKSQRHASHGAAEAQRRVWVSDGAVPTRQRPVTRRRRQWFSSIF